MSSKCVLGVVHRLCHVAFLCALPTAPCEVTVYMDTLKQGFLITPAQQLYLADNTHAITIHQYAESNTCCFLCGHIQHLDKSSPVQISICPAQFPPDNQTPLPSLSHPLLCHPLHRFDLLHPPKQSEHLALVWRIACRGLKAPHKGR